MNTLTITPAGAAGAYAKVRDGTGGAADPVGSFGAVLERAVGSVVDAGRAADASAAGAIAGTNGNVTEVVTSVTKAELALQTATAIRDRMVQAYQDVMRMPI